MFLQTLFYFSFFWYFNSDISESDLAELLGVNPSLAPTVIKNDPSKQELDLKITGNKIKTTPQQHHHQITDQATRKQRKNRDQKFRHLSTVQLKEMTVKIRRYQRNLYRIWISFPVKAHSKFYILFLRYFRRLYKRNVFPKCIAYTLRLMKLELCFYGKS